MNCLTFGADGDSTCEAEADFLVVVKCDGGHVTVGEPICVQHLTLLLLEPDEDIELLSAQALP